MVWLRSLSVLVLLALAACGDEPRRLPVDDDGIPDNLPGGFEARVVGGAAADPSRAPDLTDLVPGGLPADTELVDVGLVAIEGGESAELQIDVPEDGFSFTVMVYGHPGLSLIVTRAEGPFGIVLVDDEGGGTMQVDFPSQFASPNRVVSSVETGAFLFPNSPDVPFAPGRYSLRLGEYSVRNTNSGPVKTPSDAPVHVLVLGRRGTRPAIGAIDLILHFTGAEGLTAATAPDDPALASALEVMRSAYAAVGVSIASIEYVDLPVASLRTIVLGEGTCTGGDLDELFRHSADVASHGVHLFFVERFSCMLGQFDLGSAIGGISGGIPGMPRAIGTTHSGVAVSTAMFVGEPQTIAVVMAHETGHFLGLYHSQENNLFGGDPTFDNIGDTANTTIGARNNLMYFSADSETALSAGQGFVMRNNPMVAP